MIVCVITISMTTIANLEKLISDRVEHVAGYLNSGNFHCRCASNHKNFTLSITSISFHLECSLVAGHITLHYITLHYTTLHYITLHCGIDHFRLIAGLYAWIIFFLVTVLSIHPSTLICYIMNELQRKHPPGCHYFIGKICSIRQAC